MATSIKNLLEIRIFFQKKIVNILPINVMTENMLPKMNTLS